MTAISALIVDDDETDRYVARRQLSRNPRVGPVGEVDDGATAFELLTSERFEAEYGPHPPPTLILLDINMPLVSGFELVDRLQSEDAVDNDNAFIIVMVTSSSYFGDKERAEASPLIDGYIEKPLTPDKLDELLDQIGVESGP